MKTKTIITSVLILLFFQVITAQDKKETNGFAIGGSMNFVINHNLRQYAFDPLLVNNIFFGDSEYTLFAISPYVTKDINKNWALGLNLDYITSSYKSNPDALNSQINNSIGIGLFARYIFYPENKFNAYLQPNFHYSIRNTKTFRTRSPEDDINYEVKTNSIFFGANIGMMYNISEKWRAIVSIGGLRYDYNKSDYVGVVDIVDHIDNTRTSLGLNFNLSTIRFGFEFRL